MQVLEADLVQVEDVIDFGRLVVELRIRFKHCLEKGPGQNSTIVFVSGFSVVFVKFAAEIMD